MEDVGSDLWTCLNKVQENLLRGGLSHRTASGRRTRTRAISSIAEDVRINGRVWDLAEEVLAACHNPFSARGEGTFAGAFSPFLVFRLGACLGCRRAGGKPLWMLKGT